MPITCQLCNQIFEKQITNKHLQYKHNTTTFVYKEQFGQYSLSSLEHREQRRKHAIEINQRPEVKIKRNVPWSEERKAGIKGRKAPNKGVPMSEEQKQKLSETKRRNSAEKRAIGIYSPLKGKSLWSDEQKLGFSRKQKEYAVNNPDKMKERAQKSVQTKRDRGYDLAFMRGRKKSQKSIDKTQESLKLIIEQKKLLADQKYDELISKRHLILEKYDRHHYLLKCKICNHEFTITRQYFTDSKIQDKDCAYCNIGKGRSNPENEIVDFIKTLNVPIIQGVKNNTLIWPKEIDIYAYKDKLAVEYCGLYYHGEKYHKRDKDYHVSKYIACKEKDVTLLTVFEDEWTYKQDVVKSIIMFHLNKTPNIINIEDCHIDNVNFDVASEFLLQNSLYDIKEAEYYIGAYHNEELVFLMSIIDNDTIDIIDYIFKNYHYVEGVLESIINSFDKSVTVKTDLRYDDNKLFNRIGFEKIETIPPDYWYFESDSNIRYDRYTKEEVSGCSIIDWKETSKRGWDRIWDCGYNHWIWKR